MAFSGLNVPGLRVGVPPAESGIFGEHPACDLRIDSLNATP
jgi:hypothetical protein